MSTETTCVYKVATDKSFQDACVAVRRAAEAHKFGVLGTYEFSEILNAKGFPRSEQMKSIDICNPGHASRLLDAEPLTGLCMPCSILVYTEQGKTYLAAMMPVTVMPQIFPDKADEVRDTLEKVTEEIKAIINEAATG